LPRIVQFMLMLPPIAATPALAHFIVLGRGPPLAAIALGDRGRHGVDVVEAVHHHHVVVLVDDDRPKYTAGGGRTNLEAVRDAMVAR
jgi:hypothetical protein